MMRLQVLGDPQLMRQLQEVRDYYSSITRQFTLTHSPCLLFALRRNLK